MDPTNDVQGYIDSEAAALAVTEACTDVANLVISDDWSGTEPDCGNSETITVTIEDECGRQGQTSFTLTTEDNTPPTITMPSTLGPFECDVTTNSTIAADAINTAIIQAQLSDNCTCLLYTSPSPRD